MRSLRVSIPGKEYDILIEKNLRKDFSKYIKEVFAGNRIVVITDTNIEAIYCNELKEQLELANYEVKFIAIKAGEKSKNFSSLLPIYNELLDFRLTRSDLIIAFGGGVVGDLAGFVASTFLRGIDFIQIPTSLLAQVDSSVGGKVAVDLDRGKNLVGSFYHPKRVLIDTDILNTLDEKYFNDGLGEVIKYGLIKDKDLFSKLESFKDKKELKENIDEIIFSCCDIKRQVVENDEKDKGKRMLLNFGHTLGHAIENFYNYETFSHGEAVGIGMYQISLISEKIGLTNKGVAFKIKSILEKYNLPVSADVENNKLIEAIRLDKKNINDSLNIILLKDIGESFIYKTDYKFFE